MLQVSLPKRVTVEQSVALIDANHDERKAVITTVDGDFRKPAWELVQNSEAVAKLGFRNILKKPEWQTKIAEAAEKIAELDEAKTGGQSSGSGAKHSAEAVTPATSSKKRKLRASLSELSVPDDMK